MKISFSNGEVIFFKVIAAFIAIACIVCVFLFTLMAFTLDAISISDMWSQPPSYLHIQHWGWNAILIVNTLSVLVVSFIIFIFMLTGGKSPIKNPFKK